MQHPLLYCAALDIGATTIRLLAERRIEVIVLQLGKLDLASAAGKMILFVIAAMAELEWDLLVERTQSGLAAIRRRLNPCLLNN